MAGVSDDKEGQSVWNWTVSLLFGHMTRLHLSRVLPEEVKWQPIDN